MVPRLCVWTMGLCVLEVKCPIGRWRAAGLVLYNARLSGGVKRWIFHSTRHANQPNRTMPLLSISLDVVGSTELKKQLSEFSGKHKTSLDEHYRDLLRSMLVSNSTFLELVHLDPDLDIGRLTLVKRIGDEFWYVYDLDGLEPPEITRHATHMVKALLAFLLEAPFDVTAFLPDAHIREEIFWKCTLDLINHAVDTSRLAEVELDEFIGNLAPGDAHIVRTGGVQTMAAHSALAIKNKLGVGFSYLQEGGPVHVTRPDFIGLEVDRFFRISRDAEKGKILAGRNFLSLLLTYISPVSGKYSFRDPIGLDSFTTALSEVSVVPRQFSEVRLKGIKGGYSGAYLFNEYSERADYEGSWGLGR